MPNNKFRKEIKDLKMEISLLRKKKEEEEKVIMMRKEIIKLKAKARSLKAPSQLKKVFQEARDLSGKISRRLERSLK